MSECACDVCACVCTRVVRGVGVAAPVDGGMEMGLQLSRIPCPSSGTRGFPGAGNLEFGPEINALRRGKTLAISKKLLMQGI